MVLLGLLLFMLPILGVILVRTKIYKKTRVKILLTVMGALCLLGVFGFSEITDLETDLDACIEEYASVDYLLDSYGKCIEGSIYMDDIDTYYDCIEIMNDYVIDTYRD